MQKDKIKITATVLCEDSQHRISLTEKGSLVFHDHPKDFMRKEKAFDALGGKMCKCYRVLLAWKSSLRNLSGFCDDSIPPELRDESKKARERGLYKNSWCQKGMYDIHKQTKRITDYLVAKLFRKYCMAARGFMRIEFAISNFSPKSYNLSMSAYIDDSYRCGSVNPVFKIKIEDMPLNWYEQVYKKGLAVVDNTLVLAITNENNKKQKETINVLAVRSCGINVTIEPAIVNIQGFNKSLVWESDKRILIWHKRSLK